MPHKHYRAGEHHFRQGLVIVLLQVGVHGAESVIARLVAAGYLIDVHIFVVVLLPAWQDPVPPENISHAALAAAEHAGITAQGHAHVVVKGIGAAHQAAFVYQAFQLEAGVMHLFEFGRSPQDLPGRVECFNSALLLPDGHLPQIPLVGIAGGMQLQLRHQRVQPDSNPVIGKDHPLQFMMRSQLGQNANKALKLIVVVKLVVHSIDRADAPDPAFGDSQEVIAVADILGTTPDGVRRVRIGAVLAVEDEADMGKHFAFVVGKFAVYMVNIVFPFFNFL